MSSINSKLGLTPARRRSMMQLPKDRALRNRLTAAPCSSCGQRGARLSQLVVEPATLVCSWCPTSWPLAAPATNAS